MPAPTHYERLGVRRDASLEEIRTAYRAVARRLHPDSAAGSGSAAMAAVNEAWRVLSDPGRRALYDRSLNGDRSVPAASTPSDRQGRDDEEGDDDLVRVAPAAGSGRFPIWPFVLVFVFIAIFIFTAGGLSDDPKPPQPDSLLVPGSCVTVIANGDVIEAACTTPHDGVVKNMVDFDQVCPANTETRRDRQGRGWVCVVDG